MAREPLRSIGEHNSVTIFADLAKGILDASKIKGICNVASNDLKKYPPPYPPHKKPTYPLIID
jgi:hypothetical protein